MSDLKIIVTGLELIRSPILGYNPDKMDNIKAAYKMADLINHIVHYSMALAIYFPDVPEQGRHEAACRMARSVKYPPEEATDD